MRDRRTWIVMNELGVQHTGRFARAEADSQVRQVDN
jgi:hypothetical protein